MKICHISDTHKEHWKVQIPDDIDVLIHSGDISPTGLKYDVELFLEWFKNQHATYKIFIAGNHDLSFDPKFNNGKKPEWLIEALSDFTKYDALNFYLENSSCEIEGIKFWGSPYSAWFHGENWALNVHRGKDSKELYDTIPVGTDVIITHGPAAYKLDYTKSNDYAGCEALRDAIKRIKPKYHLCGHIHEAYGMDYDADTTYLNSSIMNHYYSPINKPQVFEL